MGYSILLISSNIIFISFLWAYTRCPTPLSVQPHIGKEITSIFKDAAASSMKYINDFGFDYSNAKDEELTEKAKELKNNLLKHMTWRNK